MRCEKLLISMTRTLVLYILVVFSLRIMGKRQIGELQPSELVVAIMISDLVSVPMSDNAIPLLYGIVPMFTLVFAETFLSYLCMKSSRIRIIATSKPAYIINNGVLNQKEMKKSRYSIADLMEELRMLDVHNISDVHCALLETNGKISVITKDKTDSVGYMLICDGKVQKNILENSPYNYKQLQKFIGNVDVKDIFILSVDGNEKVYCCLKER